MEIFISKINLENYVVQIMQLYSLKSFLIFIHIYNMELCLDRIYIYWKKKLVLESLKRVILFCCHKQNDRTQEYVKI